MDRVVNRDLKVSELQAGIPYVVVNLPYGSTLRKGDKIRIDTDGKMLCYVARWQLAEDDWKKLSRVRFKVDIDGIFKTAMKAKKDYEALMNLYRTHT
jgi:hypothetical protein